MLAMGPCSSGSAGSVTSGARVHRRGMHPRSQKTGHDSQWRVFSASKCRLFSSLDGVLQGMTRCDGSPFPPRPRRSAGMWRPATWLAACCGGVQGSMRRRWRPRGQAHTIRVCLASTGAEVEALLGTPLFQWVDACAQWEFLSDAAMADRMGLKSTTVSVAVAFHSPPLGSSRYAAERGSQPAPNRVVMTAAMLPPTRRHRLVGGSCSIRGRMIFHARSAARCWSFHQVHQERISSIPMEKTRFVVANGNGECGGAATLPPSGA